MDPRASLDTVAKRKFPAPAAKQTLEPRSSSSLPSRYRGTRKVTKHNCNPFYATYMISHLEATALHLVLQKNQCK